MNQVNGIGRIGSLDSRTTSTGTPVTSFSVALNERFTGKDGKPVEKVVWVRVTCWRKLGEIAKAILNVGDLVAFTGQLEQPSVYKNAKGEYVASLEITGEHIEKLSKKGEHGNGVAPAPQENHLPAADMADEAATIPLGDQPPF
jgi:single-strand DNA-binding protein